MKCKTLMRTRSAYNWPLYVNHSIKKHMFWIKDCLDSSAIGQSVKLKESCENAQSIFKIIKE